MFPALFISLLLPAAPTTNQLQTAQTHLLQEQWEDAASILDELATKDNPTAEIMYDRGIAHYNLNQFGVAAEAFEDAMVISENQALQTHSAFNYGNAVFQKTMQELEGTGTATSSDEAIGAIEKAKEQIKQVLQSYRRAISEDASDMDARANGEFAWQMLTQLDQMQEQMEEQQQQQQQEQKDQEQSQDEKSADEQEKNQQNKEQGDSEQEQQDESKQSDQQQDDQQGEQSEQDKQPKQDGEQSDQQQDAQQGEQSEQDKQPKQDGEQSDQQQDAQQGEQSEQDGEQSDQKEQDETQQDISEGELETEQEPTSETEVSKATKKEDGKRLSKDEAARLLQRIRDKEQQRRKALAAKRAQRRTPVDKDW